MEPSAFRPDFAVVVNSAGSAGSLAVLEGLLEQRDLGKDRQPAVCHP